MQKRPKAGPCSAARHRHLPTPRRPPAPRAWSRLLLLACLGLAGGCRDKPPPNEGVAARCAQACQRVGCAAMDASACNRDCVLRGAVAARAQCEREHATLLGCVAGAQPDCGQRCAGGACLGPPRTSSCGAERRGLERCLAPCRDEGVSQALSRKVGRSEQVAMLEVERSGCGKCSQVSPDGAPPGSPCAAASVCGRSCCECGNSPGRHHVRACVAGKCAAPERACALASEWVTGICSGSY